MHRIYQHTRNARPTWCHKNARPTISTASTSCCGVSLKESIPSTHRTPFGSPRHPRGTPYAWNRRHSPRRFGRSSGNRAPLRTVSPPIASVPRRNFAEESSSDTRGLRINSRPNPHRNTSNERWKFGRQDTSRWSEWWAEALCLAPRSRNNRGSYRSIIEFGNGSGWRRCGLGLVGCVGSVVRNRRIEFVDEFHAAAEIRAQIQRNHLVERAHAGVRAATALIMAFRNVVD